MTTLSSGRFASELAIVQNPALGAYVIWRFGLSFQAEEERPVLMPLVFLVLPLLMHHSSLAAITSTYKNSGLALFAAKLGKEQETLLAIQERAIMLRTLTLQSIGIGVTASLLTIDYAAATVRANQVTPKPRRSILPERLKGVEGAAEKLGYWFYKSGIQNVATVLRVEF